MTVLWRFGAWQVRDNGVRAPYRDFSIPAEQILSTRSAGELGHELLQRIPVNEISYAEELDMLDAVWTAGEWFGARASVRRGWRPDLFHREFAPIKPDRDGRIRSAMAERFYILRRDGYRCQLCGASAQDGVRLEVDHKVPRARGGTEDVGNKWTLCFDCNRGKRTDTLYDESADHARVDS